MVLSRPFPGSRIALFAAALFTLALAGCGASESPQPIAGEEAPAAAPAKPAAEPANFVFRNGRVYTVNEAQPWAEAVAVRGNEIVYVGDAAGAEAFVGSGTEVIDLDGKMLLPGFVEGHFHPMAGAMVARGAGLQTDDKDELLEKIRAHVTANPDDDLVAGYGWRSNVFPDDGPRKEDLDAIESERPIYLWAIDAHSAWVNSRALELGGVDASHPDPQPPFSYYKRDADGTPTGWVVEIPAQFELLSKLMTPDAAYIQAGLAEWMPRFSAAGITSVIDAGIMGVDMDEGFQMYMQMEQEGRLPIRVVGSYYWNDPDIDPLPDLRRIRSAYNSELVQASKLKINLDGGDEKYTGVLIEPYSDREDGYRGTPIIPAEILDPIVKQADAEGIDVFCHCFLDGAVRMLLDAVEGAIAANPPRDRRHATSHMPLVHPDDVTRFAELGVVADYSMGWGALDPLIDGITRRRLGEERLRRYMGAKELLNAGAHFSMGTDWPASGYLSTHEPLVSIQTAVTRQVLAPPLEPPLGGEEAKLTLAEAIRGNTLGSAYLAGLDDKVGTIEVGKLADLIVLERNLFDVPEQEIHETKVLLTLMNGRVTHREDSL